MNVLISVAMATYNGANFLEAQLDSLAAQTRLPDELVVTDTIPLSEKIIATGKIRVLSIAPLLAEAVRRINNEESISAMFDYQGTWAIP